MPKGELYEFLYNFFNRINKDLAKYKKDVQSGHELRKRNKHKTFYLTYYADGWCGEGTEHLRSFIKQVVPNNKTIIHIEYDEDDEDAQRIVLLFDKILSRPEAKAIALSYNVKNNAPHQK